MRQRAARGGIPSLGRFTRGMKRPERGVGLGYDDVDQPSSHPWLTSSCTYAHRRRPADGRYIITFPIITFIMIVYALLSRSIAFQHIQNTHTCGSKTATPTLSRPRLVTFLANSVHRQKDPLPQTIVGSLPSALVSLALWSRLLLSLHCKPLCLQLSPDSCTTVIVCPLPGPPLHPAHSHAPESSVQSPQ